MPLLFCLLAQTLTRAANVPRETLELSRNWYPSAAQSCNCFSCFWSDATVLVALLVVNTKGRSPQKAIYGREIIPHLHSFVKSFWRDFSKKFSPHSAHNPETVRTFAPRDETQKQGNLKLPHFCYWDWKRFLIQFQIQSENDFRFENWIWIWFSIWKRLHVSRETWKWIYKKPIYGTKLYYSRIWIVKHFLVKTLWRFWPLESQKGKKLLRSMECPVIL